MEHLRGHVSKRARCQSDLHEQIPNAARVLRPTRSVVSYMPCRRRQHVMERMSGTMAIEHGREASEAQIAVHWREEEYVRPSARFVGQANVADPADGRTYASR